MIVYRAELWNSTIETWTHAVADLSPAQPSFSRVDERAPSLKPWHVKLGPPCSPALTNWASVLHSKGEITARVRKASQDAKWSLEQAATKAQVSRMASRRSAQANLQPEQRCLSRPEGPQPTTLYTHHPAPDISVNEGPAKPLDQLKAPSVTVYDGSSDQLQYGTASQTQGQVRADHLAELGSFNMYTADDRQRPLQPVRTTQAPQTSEAAPTAQTTQTSTAQPAQRKPRSRFSSGPWIKFKSPIKSSRRSKQPAADSVGPTTQQQRMSVHGLFNEGPSQPSTIRESQRQAPPSGFEGGVFLEPAREPRREPRRDASGNGAAEALVINPPTPQKRTPTRDGSRDVSRNSSPFREPVEQGTLHTYQIPGAQTIRSSSVPSQHMVTQLNLPCKLQWTIIPKLRAAAYLDASIRKISGFTILPDKAGMTIDSSFTGSFTLPHCTQR